MRWPRVAAVCACALALAACLGCAQASGGGQSASDAAGSSSASASSDALDSTQSSDVALADASSVSVVDAAYVASLEDGAYLVDVRTPEEYAEGHIPGALNASYPKSTGGPCQSEENASSFRAAWEKLGVPADAHVVLYCRTGVRASAAYSALVEDGYANVELYEGSWADWTSDSARPVE